MIPTSSTPSTLGAADGERAASFDSLDPATGEVIGSYPVQDAADVQTAVTRAQAGAEFWSSLTYPQRAARLLTWAGVLTRRMAQLTELVHAETGKPHSDAQLEIVITIEQLTWAARNAGKVLAGRTVSTGLLSRNQAARVEYLPYGVVGVIGPWNYPVYTPMGAIGGALAAGNAVVYKPSEFAPGVGHFLVDTFGQVVPEAPVLQLVTGFGETGTALCRGGVDKIAFTGSAATGRKVMHACADGLVPLVVEAGGKDALLVDADADLAAAAEAAVWAGLVNSGQTCVGVERIYVHERVIDAFCSEIVRLTADLRSGPGEKLGPMTTPNGPVHVRHHIRDAVDRGARALVGGDSVIGDTFIGDGVGADPVVADRYVQPTVLVDVPEDAAAMREETFGPTLTITAVADMDQAVRLANASDFGLGASVFSSSRGMELARLLRVGMVSVNSVIAFTGIPALPFGGVQQSGFGRVHGADGLREFATTKAIARQRFSSPAKVTTFARSAGLDKAMATITTLRRGHAATLPPRARRGRPWRRGSADR